MLSREAILQEIDKVLERSEKLYGQAVAKHKECTERALGGSGLGDSQKLALARSIRNNGLQKGGAVSRFITEGDGIQSMHIPESEDLQSPPSPATDMTEYFRNTPSPDDAVGHFKLPGETQGGYPGAPASEDSAFASAIQSQYPLVDLSQITRPVPMTLEAHYSKPTTPHYEPTSGGPSVNESLGFPDLSPSKVQFMTPLQKLVALFDIYATGGSLKLAKVKLGIR